MKTIQLMIKGLKYYDVETCYDKNILYAGQPLILKLEPSNLFDYYAVQLWVQISQKEYLLGYIPRTHSRWVCYLQKNNNPIVKIDDMSKTINLFKINITLEYKYRWWNYIDYTMYLFNLKFQFKTTKC